MFIHDFVSPSTLELSNICPRKPVHMYSTKAHKHNHANLKQLFLKEYLKSKMLSSVINPYITGSLQNVLQPIATYFYTIDVAQAYKSPKRKREHGKETIKCDSDYPVFSEYEHLSSATK